MSDLLDVVPADRRETARSALTAAFGGGRLKSLRAVRGGASAALIYRVHIGERPYLLRLEPTVSDGFHDPRRSFACMTIAADAGIAPALHHADPANGVAIMDFVPQRPIRDYPGGPEPLVRALGELAARLQQAPAFPPMLSYFDMVGQLLAVVRASSRFAPGLFDAHADGLARIREAYRWDSEALVSAHNDANYGNIIFDGARLWLIDWATAFRNDPLVDVAIMANFAATPELEDVLLRSWLGRAPGRLTRARFLLMRQTTRLFYGAVMLNIFVGRSAGAPMSDLGAPTLAEFDLGVADGRYVIGEPPTMIAFGKSFLRAFIAGLSDPGFEDALHISQRN